MTLDQPSFVKALDATIARHAMLSHPFYKAWSEGRLDLDTLRRYARQYFAQVKAFPTYVSGVHASTEDLELRRELLENLIEEERGEDNHPELWTRFAEGLGVTREELDSTELLDSTKSSVEALRSLTRSDTIEGLAALYAYESQIPQVANTKRAGLSEFYGIDDQRTVEFFKVHEHYDVAHSASERDALARLCPDGARQQRALDAAETGARALWGFLDGVSAAYMPELELCDH